MQKNLIVSDHQYENTDPGNIFNADPFADNNERYAKMNKKMTDDYKKMNDDFADKFRFSFR